MLHKRNDFEILEILLKEDSHVREIAAKLNMIPSTVMRILKRMQKEGIVDFKKEGRNTRYFLKKTTEAKISAQMVENYRLQKIMQNPSLRMVLMELIESTEGELIVLFGSHAKGNATEKSDIDIYLETKDSSLKEKLRKISDKLSIKIGNFDKESLLAKEIIKDHIIIQNVDRFYRLIR